MDGASIDPYVVAAIVAVLATTVGALVWVLKFVFTKLLPAFEEQSQLTSKLIVATASNTRATKSADTYLRERNGRDNEFQQQNLEALAAIPEKMQQIADKQATTIIAGVKVQEQHVEHLHIDKEIVNKKDS